MSGNSNLHKAKDLKNDEFYTQLGDIENELKHYKEHFKGKVVYCNCDDPYESNFFKYFAMNFNFLGLKKLICTSYATSPIAHSKLNLLGEKKSYKIEINKVYDANGDGAEDLADVEQLLREGKGENKLTPLKGDGDFRSKECVELLKQADIVCTNPPFSLFREYISQLIEYNKSFIIIGNMNAITHKDVFPFIKSNKVWTGFKHFGGGMDMIMPKTVFDETKLKKFYINDKGEIIQNIMGVIWYTNLDISKRHENLILYKQYSEEEFPKYDNYDAINVNKVVDIPMNYDGIIGVPITFIDSYNPEQFEILGCSYSYGDIGEPRHKKGDSFNVSVDGKNVYKRLFIRRKK